MAKSSGAQRPNPWRPVFDELREHYAGKTDERGAIASINWLRDEMRKYGGNPNIIRNIIYRNKGRMPDKRALYRVFIAMWKNAGKGTLRVPELDYLITPGNEIDQEVIQLLGREKRQAYKRFVGDMREGKAPKLLLEGRNGSGKTILADYIQHALEHLGSGTPTIARFEFGTADLTTSLARLASVFGVKGRVFDALLAQVGTSRSYAEQADTQAAVAREIIAAAKRLPERLVLMVYVSRRLDEHSHIGDMPLRLNTADVSQVGAVEWLWFSVFEPLSHVDNLAMIISTTATPALIHERLGGFRAPVRLQPPTHSEALRYIRGRLPNSTEAEQLEILAQAGRSYEELRSATLLIEAQHTLPSGTPDDSFVEALAELLVADIDISFRRFLRAVAVLSLPEWPNIRLDILKQVIGDAHENLDALGMQFIDYVPGTTNCYRPFSRRFTRALQEKFLQTHPERYRQLHRFAATVYHAEASQDPTGQAAGRMVLHLCRGHNWVSLVRWFEQFPIPHQVVTAMWNLAEAASEDGTIEPGTFELVAQSIVRHYLTLGSYDHQDVTRALAVLDQSETLELQIWSRLRRAQAELLKKNLHLGAELLSELPPITDPHLAIDAALLHTEVAYLRRDSHAVETLVTNDVLAPLARLSGAETHDYLAIRASMWHARVLKLQGNHIGALTRLVPLKTDNPIMASRIAYQIGDCAVLLGLFSLAENRLQKGYELASASRVRAEERVYFPLRLAVLYRHRGAFSKAREWLVSAGNIMYHAPKNEQTAFLQALIASEFGLLNLAYGNADRALEEFGKALDLLEQHSAVHAMQIDAYKQRTRMYIALAYAVRGSGVAFRKPHPVPHPHAPHVDIDHAIAELTELQHELSQQTLCGRGISLQAQVLFALILYDPNLEHKQSYVRQLFTLRLQPRQLFEAKLLAASVELTHNDVVAAYRYLDEATATSRSLRQDGLRFAEVFGIEEEHGHDGLRAQLHAYRISAHIHRRQPLAAAAVLSQCLKNNVYHLHHEALLRVFGTTIEALDAAESWKQHRELQQLLRVDGTGTSTPMRLPDALVAGWKARNVSPDG